ncbi:mitochondrial carrier [Viridothelium virens]|uniref:Mitochondrial carrier n=1 Tax=Viridothelium virens TaxID=1048519 RepID=A0A6A6GZ84_VIRVR|nr:mitochondrial carrier [Viridothelium virens]
MLIETVYLMCFVEHQAWPVEAKNCAAAPIAGYGALNGILFFSYNRTLHLLNSAPTTSSSSSPTPDWKTFLAGAIGGLATFVVSAPTELVKCRAQTHIPLNPGAPQPNSWTITKQLWREGGRWGLPGLYIGGGVTSVRDAVGYGFYFWTYDTLTTTLHSPAESPLRAHLITLWCGGLAGCATWTSVFPLDVVKTRLQAQATQLSTISSIEESHGQPLQRPSAWAVGRVVWQQGGWAGFWRGLGVCNVRAFVVNAVQWSVYESAMRMLAS